MPLTETHPQLVKEWHPTRNLPLEPSQQLARWKRVVWQCSVTKDHVWEMKIYFRTYHKSGCPHCLRIRKTKPIILAKQSPVFTDEWHPTLNGSLKPTDSLKQAQVVHWQCRTHPDHTWSTQVLARVHLDAGCPHCRRTFSNRRSIARLIPSVAAEWHPTKNGTLSPEKVQYKSRANIWWVCSKCSFEWKASPFYRYARLDVCPNCNPIPLSQPLSESHRLVAANGTQHSTDLSVLATCFPLGRRGAWCGGNAREDTRRMSTFGSACATSDVRNVTRKRPKATHLS
eukprot:415157_1